MNQQDQQDCTYDILLAEDELVSQKVVLKILAKYGHSIELAENGNVALQAFLDRALQNKPFDVILVHSSVVISPREAHISKMDVSMPLMGGMEATQRIRTYEMQYNLLPMPIIALTAHASAWYFLRTKFGLLTSLAVMGDRERCLQAGMVRTLPLPTSLLTLDFVGRLHREYVRPS
jgi:osomolarity two-component system sensor histidine kinase NIK1